MSVDPNGVSRARSSVTEEREPDLPHRHAEVPNARVNVQRSPEPLLGEEEGDAAHGPTSQPFEDPRNTDALKAGAKSNKAVE